MYRLVYETLDGFQQEEYIQDKQAALIEAADLYEKFGYVEVHHEN